MAIATISGTPLLPTKLHIVASGRKIEEGRGRGSEARMAAAASRVAVVGAGISGAVCASMLAGRGISVTVFDSGRGPGGRMSQRRESTEAGDLVFDHGAPYFTIANEEAMDLVTSWERMGVVAQWNERFGCFDVSTSKFVDLENDGEKKKYVGVPGMNSVCKALCSHPGIQTKFQTTIGKLDWLEGMDSWLLSGSGGESLGYFDSVIVSDKSLFSSRHSTLTGRPPPLELVLFTGVLEHGDFIDTNIVPRLAEKLHDIPVRPCYALMLSFSEPLPEIPVKGFAFKNSKTLNWAFCDSSKPGRQYTTPLSECWVVHSTAEYADGIISRTGLKKHSATVLSEIAEELFREFEGTGLVKTRPFFMKAHRWGSAFPASAIGGEDLCLWDESRRLAICGDFCASPSIEGALLSGLRASSKLSNLLSSL
ncbi:FAD/NAD(P)-binding oxidoreductase family protein isoform X2 [Wolffia australiana]